MLDFFTIFTKSGIILWYYSQDCLGVSKIKDSVNELIRSVILQERAGSQNFCHENVQMKHFRDNEFELIYVVGFQKNYTLSYVDKLIDDVHHKFRDMYKEDLVMGCYHTLKTNYRFSDEFQALYKAAENVVVAPKKMKTFGESDKSKKTVESMIKNKNKSTKQPAKTTKKNKKNGKKKPEEPVVEEPVEDPVVEEDHDEEPVVEDDPMGDQENIGAVDIQKNMEAMRKKMASPRMGGGNKKQNKKTKKGKEKRTWDQDATGKEAAALDYSGRNNKKKDEEYVVTEQEKKWTEMKMQDLSAHSNFSKVSTSSDKKKSGGGWTSMFSKLNWSKPLTKEDLEPALQKMRMHLIDKNVATPIAEKLTDSISAKLEGKVLGTFDSINATVRSSLQESMVQLLTPKKRVDILQDIVHAQRADRPYVITFCGVNGVGKSTNLAKITFWLMKQNFRVLIAACDTFRAGAVEQLRTHEKRLNAIYPPESDRHGKRCHVYEKGYGKDAAHIAQQAIYSAKQERFDVVMIDTAGRMQDNEPLMRSLSKLVTLNNPDLVLFVGEALVGNEAVDQLTRFNEALQDHSAVQNPHTIDGIVLTKFDTIDSKVGAAVSMTYTSGQPIVFVGIGQTYPDLCTLDADSVVKALLQ